MPIRTPIGLDSGLHLVEMNPGKFYALIKLAKSIDKTTYDCLDSFVKDLETTCEQIDEMVDGLAKVNNDFLAEVRATTRRKNPFAGEDPDDGLGDLRHTIGGQNFLRVIFDVMALIQRGFFNIYETARGVRPTDFVLSKAKGASKGGGMDLMKFGDMYDSAEDMQKVMFEVQLNQGSLQRFVDGLAMVEGVKNSIINIARMVGDKMENYYQTLVKRHTIEGVAIHGDPVTTDVAMTIFENVDAHGEIQGGKKPDEVTAYSIRKATIVADAVKSGLIGEFIKNPDKLLQFIDGNLRTLWTLADRINSLFKDKSVEAKEIMGYGGFKRVHEMPDSEFNLAVTLLKDLDPRSVVFKESKGLQTPEERHSLKFQNETLKTITWRLAGNGSTSELIHYILDRKAELRDYYLEENSFYVCKQGAGNPFSGDPPGALVVAPGTRPVVNIAEIIGSNFDEVKEFMGLVEKASKWHDLFTATSPSRTADKSNALLIGPQGCHRKGQKVIMHDGTLLAVEDVRVGDMLMGPDSKPRSVQKLHRGTDEMVEIIPTKGESWVVNKGHILTLVRTSKRLGKCIRGNYHRKATYTAVNEIKDVGVGEYLDWSTTQKHIHALFRVPLDFVPADPLPLEPYFLGVLLGDGCLRNRVAVTNADQAIVKEVYVQAGAFSLHVNIEKDGVVAPTYHMSGTSGIANPITTILRSLDLFGCDSETKFIPHAYKTASREDRLELLAGLIDTDGDMAGNCHYYTSKSPALVADLAFVARSLGFAAYVSPCKKRDQNGTEGTYHRVTISGHTDTIPVRVEYKQAGPRRQVKKVLRTGFKTRELPPEEYFGFTLDGDHRYLLDDFTVTHNCGKSEILRAVGGDKKSIGIFATGSDFLTCWKGEAEKNPKRLFEAAIGLQRESKKHIHILIDEIDTILNKDSGRESFGGFNLVTEFQNLMDGVVHYPHLSVWGATNNPERLPMPILRRFSKVWIVGELSRTDRVSLLKHFASFMPVHSDFPEVEWEKAADTLEGATGDVIRKIVDYVWREKMGHFVGNHHEMASKALDLLNANGVKFTIHEFDTKSRRVLHDILRPFVGVTPEDVHKSIDLHLGNVAIHHEIRTAKETYAKSKQFLASIKRNTVNSTVGTKLAEAESKA